jgi:hypothetical protein
MTISRLNIDGSTYRQQDFLDLCLTLQNSDTKRVVVMYKEDGVLGLSKKRTEYVRNIHTNDWVMIKNKGRHCSQRVKVVKDFSSRQLIIQYI